MRYDPRAEPTLGTIVPGRPAYLPRRVIDERATAKTGWVRRWSLGGAVVAVELAEHVVARPWDEWGARADLERAIAWWLPRQLRAGSPSGLIHQAAPDWYRPARWTYHGFTFRGMRGGWEEAQVRGVIAGPHVMLDLRRAYRWALTVEDLPDRRALWVQRVGFTWRRPGIHLVQLHGHWKGAPWPQRDGGLVLVETPTDVDLYGMPNVRRWVAGVSWRATRSAQPLADVLDEIGVAALHRAYWGSWAAQTPTKCTTARNQTTRALPPYGADGMRAFLILQRVRRRLAEVETHYRYVDAVIVRKEDAPATGDGLGDWRVIREWDEGVRIGRAGAYGPAVGPFEKWAGVPQERRA